jgi:hypothetical protein
VLIKILLTVIVGYLLSFLDRAFRKDKDALVVYERLCVRAAGMINISSLVDTRLPVDGLLLSYLKKILAAARICLFGTDFPTYVLDDAGILRDRFASEHAESCSLACARALYIEFKGTGYIPASESYHTYSMRAAWFLRSNQLHRSVLPLAEGMNSGS